MHMLQSISQELAKNGIINQEDIEVCVFGLKQGAILLLNIFSTIAIGFLLGMLLESIAFLLAFVPLRFFAGGFHAKTQAKCYTLGIISTFVTLLLSRYILSNLVFFTLGIASSAVIYSFAPVQDGNKPLDEIEIAVYRKISLIILALENLIMVFFHITGIQRISNCILFSLVLLSIAVILGKIPHAAKMSD